MSEAKIKCSRCDNDATEFVSELVEVDFTPPTTNTAGGSVDQFGNVPYCDEHYQALIPYRLYLRTVNEGHRSTET